MLIAKTRRQAALEWLRSAILDGTYAPGSRLKQEELASRLGCSPIPIREALHQLATEGFVILDPQRGSRVREFSGRNLAEIYEVRTLIEGLAARRAAQRFTASAGARARAALHKMDQAGLTPAERVRLNWEFHDNVYGCADQQILAELILQLRRAVEPYLRLDAMKAENWQAGQRDHRRILEACMRGDAEAAARFTATHIRRTGRRLVATFPPHSG